jgi:hypothetical protein
MGGGRTTDQWPRPGYKTVSCEFKRLTVGRAEA